MQVNDKLEKFRKELDRVVDERVFKAHQHEQAEFDNIYSNKIDQLNELFMKQQQDFHQKQLDQYQYFHQQQLQHEQQHLEQFQQLFAQCQQQQQKKGN